MSEYAILDGRTVVPTTQLRAAFEGDRPPKMGNDTIGESHVSTVFLSINHGWNGTDLWFETMIFGGPYADYQERYTTYDEAEAGHKRIVEALKAGKSPDPEFPGNV